MWVGMVKSSVLHWHNNEREVTLVAREPLRHVVLYTMSRKRKQVWELKLNHTHLAFESRHGWPKKKKGGKWFTEMLKKVLKGGKWRSPSSRSNCFAYIIILSKKWRLTQALEQGVFLKPKKYKFFTNFKNFICYQFQKFSFGTNYVFICYKSYKVLLLPVSKMSLVTFQQGTSFGFQSQII